MPGIKYVRAAADGGQLKGGAPRAVWQTLGADPLTVSARSAAQRLEQLGEASHLVWNPVSGEIVQLIPIVRAARSLGGAGGAAHASWADQVTLAEVTREGRICAQVCVVAFAEEPFTESPMTGLIEIMAWLDSWGVSRRWPAGPPAAYPSGRVAQRSRRSWARGGHFGASQVPGLAAGGPGAVDVARLTGWSAAHRTDEVPSGDRPAPMTSHAPTGERPDLSEFLGAHVASAAALTRAR